MDRIPLTSLLLVGLMAPAALTASPAFKVTNNNDSGDGSLRAALASQATHIVIPESVGNISVTESLVYNGTQALTITGSGQTIDGSSLLDNSAPVFEVSQGANLDISNLVFEGGGGYSRLNQGGGKGIFVDIPETRTGLVKVRLSNVSVFRVGNHGIHISDCSLGDDCGGGGGGGGDGSVASIHVSINKVVVDGVGFGKQDADGLRVDDRNEGDIIFEAHNSRFINVGADGIELDEGNLGDVKVDMSNVTFEGNGAYCLEGPFIAGDPCDDDGDPDVDDAFDIDEAGPGNVLGKMANLTMTNNHDEGLDFDEENDGGFDIELINVHAENNEDEGIKVSEENSGDINVSVRNATLQLNNGDKEGIEIEEADDGHLAVRIVGSTVLEKVKIEEDGGGAGTVKVRDSSIEELDLSEDISQL